jgi:hypothetical protein
MNNEPSLASYLIMKRSSAQRTEPRELYNDEYLQIRTTCIVIADKMEI